MGESAESRLKTTDSNGEQPRPRPVSVVPDVPALMAEIRARVTADIERNRNRRAAFSGHRPDIDAGAPRRAGELLHSEELRQLNLRHAYARRMNPDAISSHRGGLLGRAIVAVKRRAARVLRDSLLADYFAEEHEFHANLTRFLNELAKYVDARDAANFWELVRKVDYDVTKALSRIEEIRDEGSASLRSSERRLIDLVNAGNEGLQRNLDSVASGAASDRARLATLESVAAGLETIIARLGRPAASAAAAENTPAVSADYTYVLFENRFRGDEGEIRRRLEIYPPVFASAGEDAPVLEIGGGRGELLELFRECGIPAYSVDIDAAMAGLARAKGLDARHGDGIEHLRSLADDSLRGVIAVQVVEHLPFEALRELISLAASKVRPGGAVVFETINPQSLLALSSNYFRDPTHVAPLHPDTLSHLMQVGGLAAPEVRYLSPVAQKALLAELPVEDYMTPRWAHTIERLNGNIRRLNGLLFGAQDFCVIARVPDA